jgi:hypothetical protein
VKGAAVLGGRGKNIGKTRQENNMDSSSVLSGSEDMANVLEETKALFRGSLDAALLKKQARQIEEIKDMLAECEEFGAKALVKALQAMPVPIQDDELDALHAEISKQKAEIAALHTKQQLALAKREATVGEKDELLKEEQRLEEEWVRLGGEQEARRREEAARISASTPMLRKAIGLHQNITKIKWDYSASESELAGTVVDPQTERAVDFRFSGGSDFELANRVWAVIG